MKREYMIALFREFDKRWNI